MRPHDDIVLLDTGGTRDPRFNLALEEHLVRSGSGSIVLLYVNDPAIVLGKHQNPLQETDLSRFLSERDVRLVRRISGGGTVYHDHGNLNISLITPYRTDRHNSYAYFLDPIIAYLRRRGVGASINRRNSLVLDDGRKVSGCAQFVSGERMMTHGTLLFDADLDRLDRLLGPGQGVVASRAVPSVRSSVANLAPLLPSLKDLDALAADIARLYAGDPPTVRRLAEEDRHEVDRLVATRYGEWSWIWGRSPKFTLCVTDRCGRQRKLTVADGMIIACDPAFGEDDERDPVGSRVDRLLEQEGYRLVDLDPGSIERGGER